MYFFNPIKYTLALALLSSVLGKTKIADKVTSDMNQRKIIPILIQLRPADLPIFNVSFDSQINQQAAIEAHAQNIVNILETHAEETKGNVQNLLEHYKAIGKIKNYRFYKISNTFAVEAPKELVEKLASFNEVEEISSNHVNSIALKMIENNKDDDGEEVKWTGKEIHWSLKFINATNLNRSVYKAAKHLRYANADSGVDFNHPAIFNNYLGKKHFGRIDHNYSWFDASKFFNGTNSEPGTGSPVPVDDKGHGTHTMGTAVGGLNLGVSPTTKWMACKNTEKGLGSPETYLGCLQFFLAPTNLNGTKPRPYLRPHVVGNSYTCPGEEGCTRSTFKYALRAMKSAGIFMSVSAGNDGLKGCSSIISPPALDPNSFTVAASKYQSFKRGIFSSLGPVDERPFMAIDVAAPGVNITSAVPGGKYSSKFGTSMACPHVSGAALLVIAACPHLNRRVDLIAKVLRQSATPVLPVLKCGRDTATTIPNNEMGYGVINVGKALEICKKTYY